MDGGGAGGPAGLVLSGGGARGAYQAGALRGIAEALGDEADRGPFRVLTGISAGAINAGFLASAGLRFGEATRRLWQLWEGLQLGDVVRTSAPSLAGLGVRLVTSLGLGGGDATHLLDTSPLRGLLDAHFDAGALRRHVDEGTLRGVAVTATCYATGSAVTFFDAAPEVQPWARTARVGRRTALTLDHVLASAAIPLLFPPVRVAGSWYGDGGVRMTSPLSPAVHLGAGRLVAIGVRHHRPDGQPAEPDGSGPQDRVTLAHIGGAMLDAVFLDHLESDAERMTRINATMALLSDTQRRQRATPLHVVPLLALRPSRDLGLLAAGQLGQFPRLLQHLLRGLGVSEASGLDLLSYLSFHPSYTVPLLELGRQDALARRAELEAFLAG